MDLFGYPWIPMNFYGYQWKPLNIYGYPLISMNSMNIHGHPWTSMDIRMGIQTGYLSSLGCPPPIPSPQNSKLAGYIWWSESWAIRWGDDGLQRGTRWILDESILKLTFSTELFTTFDKNPCHDFTKEIFMGSKNTEVGFVAFPANRTRLTLYTFLWKVPLNFPSFSLGSLLVYFGLFCQLYRLIGLS